VVPKYCYEVERHFAVGTDKRDREVKSYETLLAAVGFHDAAVRMQTTKRVVLRVILDEWSPSIAEVGREQTNGKAHDGHRASAAAHR